MEIREDLTWVCESDDRNFWEEFTSLLLQIVCLIERRKLKRKPTTSELRKLGKEALDKPPEP